MLNLVTKLVQNISEGRLPPSRSIGCIRGRLIFEGIESISKKFWRYLSFGKLCPKAFSVSWGWSSLRCVTNFRTCGHKSYSEVKCLPLDTKVNHPFKILFQHVPHTQLPFWKVLIWICFICVLSGFDELGSYLSNETCKWQKGEIPCNGHFAILNIWTKFQPN